MQTTMNKLFKEMASAIQVSIPQVAIEMLEAIYSPATDKFEYAASVWSNGQLYGGCGGSILAVVKAIEADMQAKGTEEEEFELMAD